MSTANLKSRTVNGALWSIISNVSIKGISFLVTLVLARLVSPEEYGLIGLSGVLTAIIASFIECGFSSALIRKKETDEIDYSTTFIINMLMSVLMYGVLFFIAPSIASFFKQPRLTLLTRVTSLCLIINAFTIVQTVKLTRALDFKTQTKVSVITAIVSGAVGITIAAFGGGVWALVAQNLTSSVVKSILFSLYNRWIPSLQFSWSVFKELFSYGWKLLVSGLIDTTWQKLNQIVIGRCYSAETLGFYSRASSFSELFSSNLTRVVQSVSFPSLSSIQDEGERLKFSYRKVIRLTMYVTFICMFGLAAVSAPMIYVLIGEKWMPAAKFLTIICFQMSFYPLHAINLNMLMVKGRSDVFLKLEIIKKLIGLGPLLLGVFVDIWWMLYSTLFTTLICYYLNSYYSGILIGYSMKEQIKDILPSFGLGILVFAIVYPMAFIKISYYLILPFQLIAGATIAFGLSILSRNEDYREIRDIGKNYIDKLRSK